MAGDDGLNKAFDGDLSDDDMALSILEIHELLGSANS